MSQYYEAGHRSFTVDAAYPRCTRVKFDGTNATVAGSTDLEVGVLSAATFASGNTADVLLRTAQGTAQFIASGVITAGNACYAAATGKVASSGTILIGIALTSAAANNDIIEVIRREESSDSSASGGTTGAAFLVDSDSTIPKIELASQTGGTGDFKGTIKPPATLTGNRVFTLPADSDQTLVGATATQTLSNKTVTGPSVAVTAGLTSSGPTGAGIGYATGAGGTVSQATDRTTGVTLSKLSGQITTQATSLAAAALVSFTVTNTTVAIGDIVVLSIQSGPSTVGTVAYVTTVAAGSFQITLKNLHASTADTGAAIINFAVIKAVSA